MATDTIRKTPYVGILVSQENVSLLINQKPNKKLSSLNKANVYAKTNLYFFSLKGINYEEKHIKGVHYDLFKKKWMRGVFPFPDVFYNHRGNINRSLSRQHKEYKTFLNRLAQLNTFYVNYVESFNKWEVYNKLRICSSLKKHLPSTQLLSSVKTLQTMFTNSSVLYVKAAKGRQGKQVIRVEKKEDGTFEYCYYHNQTFLQKVPNLYILYRKLGRFFEKKEVIVQEAIDLFEVDETKVDIRAEVQRNGQGELEIIALPIRQSPKTSPITTKSDCHTFEHFFTSIVGYSKNEVSQLKEEVEAFVKDIYLCIEKHYGPTGDLGIDCAIDNKGKLWFIESNSQSAKVSLERAYDDDTFHKAFLNHLEYATFLFERARN
ncbi:YheC/YheD family protein [Bacillus shivajii]|uniref:YheC/YheD family endospore coat-associated protein n=1 Tax=Bacillus shivajii TaxID=1983719 RepID=UPI001CFB17DA|nr:YheC/YheD family protein [Bacillus shivajii]UCZ53405.1 YheC/YheD family protein [Bacillus shivajii]